MADTIEPTPRERAADMRAAGRSYRAIATALGVSPSTVSRWARADVVETSQRGRLTNDFPNKLPMGIAQLTARRFDVMRDITVMNDAGLAFDSVRGVDMIRLALRISPEISRAVWDFERMLNPGHEIDVFIPNTETQYDEAKDVLDAFIDLLDRTYGTIKIITGKLFLQAITRGAFYAELVLDEHATRPVDLVIPDPAFIEFRTRDDPERGPVWELGQKFNGQWQSLDRPTIRYLALDADSASPYGQSMLYPAVFPAMFLVGLMYDLRRVVAQQGYQHGDVTIDLDMTKQLYPMEPDADFDARMKELKADVEASLAALLPDEWFVHTSNVDVNHTEGVIDSSSLAGAETIITAMERMLVRALKTMPLLMGMPDGVSEANANRQWEIFTRTIKELQQYAENLLQYLFQLALRIQGYEADVRVRFAELRYAEELRDAQVQWQKLQNADLMESLGYENEETASEYAVGHPPVGEKSPQQPTIAPQPVPDTSNPDATNPEPGQNRTLTAAQRATPFTPQDGDDPGPMPTSIVIDAGVKQQALGAWNKSVPDYRNLIDATAVDTSDGTE